VRCKGSYGPSARLVATLGLRLSFAPLAMKRLQQLLGDWLVKNIRADPTQRSVAACICLCPRVGEPVFCGLPRSIPQSDAAPLCI
jgi:hypothetical protein